LTFTNIYRYKKKKTNGNSTIQTGTQNVIRTKLMMNGI
jgi:hypothetical protein